MADVTTRDCTAQLWASGSGWLVEEWYGGVPAIIGLSFLGDIRHDIELMYRAEIGIAFEQCRNATLHVNF